MYRFKCVCVAVPCASERRARLLSWLLTATWLRSGTHSHVVACGCACGIGCVCICIDKPLAVFKRVEHLKVIYRDCFSVANQDYLFETNS